MAAISTKAIRHNVEERVSYLLSSESKPDTLEARTRPLTTRNLEELERELAELERKLLPLLNTVRAMRGKKPMIWPKE